MCLVTKDADHDRNVLDIIERKGPRYGQGVHARDDAEVLEEDVNNTLLLKGFFTGRQSGTVC